MKIALLTIGDYTQASTWYRIGQYLPYLESKGCHFEKFSFEKISTYDLVIVQKVLLPVSEAKKILKYAKRVIFDFDDAIWTRPGKDFSFITRWRVARRLAVWLEKADRVMVPNKVLQAKALQYRDQADLIPMAIDLTSYKKKEASMTTLGWSGAPHNLSYVETILPALQSVAAKLAIYSGKRPLFPCEHVPFTPGGESAFLEQVGIGLLPLPNDNYAKGKSPIKALQYMAAGIPFVYSGGGGVDEMVNPAFAFKANTEGEWVAHLNHLIKNPDVRHQAGLAARAHVEANFSANSIAEHLAKRLEC